MLPTDRLTSTLLEPSSGSNTSRYLPRGYSGGITYGSSISSDTIAARWPPYSLVRRKMSFAITSSGTCASPCTLTVSVLPSTPPSAPRPIRKLIRLHASRT